MWQVVRSLHHFLDIRKKKKVRFLVSIYIDLLLIDKLVRAKKHHFDGNQDSSISSTSKNQAWLGSPLMGQKNHSFLQWQIQPVRSWICGELLLGDFPQAWTPLGSLSELLDPMLLHWASSALDGRNLSTAKPQNLYRRCCMHQTTKHLLFLALFQQGYTKLHYHRPFNSYN